MILIGDYSCYIPESNGSAKKTIKRLRMLQTTCMCKFSHHLKRYRFYESLVFIKHSYRVFPNISKIIFQFMRNESILGTCFQSFCHNHFHISNGIYGLMLLVLCLGGLKCKHLLYHYKRALLPQKICMTAHVIST